jgi:hypothetical protein
VHESFFFSFFFTVFECFASACDFFINQVSFA